jgi:hypothetical protein
VSTDEIDQVGMNKTADPALNYSTTTDQSSSKTADPAQHARTDTGKVGEITDQWAENPAFRDIRAALHARRPGAARDNSKLDDALEAEILGHISRGCTWTDSAKLSGISDSTCLKWRGRGAEYLLDPAAHPEHARYGLFLQRVDEAELACKARVIDKILMCDDWRAWRFWLINRGGNEWHSEHTKTEISGPGGMPLPAANPFIVNFSITGKEEKVDWSITDHRTDEEKLANPDPWGANKPKQFLTSPKQKKEG